MTVCEYENGRPCGYRESPRPPPPRYPWNATDPDPEPEPED